MPPEQAFPWRGFDPDSTRTSSFASRFTDIVVFAGNVESFAVRDSIALVASLLGIKGKLFSDRGN